jgi:hypothetical protein
MSESQKHTPTSIAGRGVLAALAAIVLSLLILSSVAAADSTICQPGSAASQCLGAKALAVDFETGRLFVADSKNNRIDVFGPTGAFERSFGWGVKTGQSKLEVCTAVCRQGLPGSGAGQFDTPSAIAVDNSSTSASRHSVYVVDTGNARIEKFTPEGEFQLSFGSKGGGEGQFEGGGGSFDEKILVGVGPGGTIYVVDNLKSGSGFEQRLQKFEPSGTLITPTQILRNEKFSAQLLAVDFTGDFYVSPGNEIRKYDANGNFIEAIGDAFEEGQFGDGVFALAADANSNLFAASSGLGFKGSVMEFDPAGNRLRRFGYGSFFRFSAAIAPSPDPKVGGIYVGEVFEIDALGNSLGGRVIQLDFPSPGPLVLPSPCSANPIGNSKASLNAEVVPEGEATTFHFQYVDQASFEGEGGFSSPATKATVESDSIGSDFRPHAASAQADVVPETQYRCRVVATNANAPAGIAGPEGSFKSKPALEVFDTWASGVKANTATLNATVNPLGIPAQGFFEYVDDAAYQEDAKEAEEEGKSPDEVTEAGFRHSSRVPDPEDEATIDFGATESPVVAAVAIADLSPDTRYRYRLVATDVLIAPKEIAGPTRTFRTFSSGSGVGLPDNRRYELVSPARKGSAEVAVPGVAGGVFSELYIRIQAGAASGEALTYTSWTSFGKPEGASAASQYLSRRTPTGWNTANISPFGHERYALVPPYRGFSTDLGLAGVMMSEPPLTEEAIAGFENLYLRDNRTGSLQALTTEAPNIQTTHELCLNYSGASEDGSHVIFASNTSYAGAPAGDGFGLYEWSAEKGLRPVSLLPGKSVAAVPYLSTSFGAAGQNCGTGEKVVRHVISADGSRVFWTYAPEPTVKEEEQNKKPSIQLMVRISGEETLQLDKGESGSGGGIFEGASADGSKAFFIDRTKLKSGSSEGDLYLYELPGKKLKDLTPGAQAANVQGVVGLSDDGTYVYFVAAGALAPGAEPGKCAGASPSCNLYVWHEGEGLHFIAALAGEDTSDWDSAPRGLTAHVSPDGRHLAFLSIEAESLAGYDNTITTGDHCRQPFVGQVLVGSPRCPEAFVYDSETDELICASCNPSGARPAGPAILPGWSNPYEGPRFLSDDGSRLFFESRDVLLPSDENEKRDVYEFGRGGAGSCDEASTDFDPATGGCLSLISSGKSGDDSYLIDASSSGRDVFLSTRRALVGWDDNEHYDAYDAREGGGFAEPTEPSICQGEACKLPAGAPPSVTPPPTATFQGPGNPIQRRKHKAKKQEHKKQKSGHRKTHADRKAGR